MTREELIDGLVVVLLRELCKFSGEEPKLDDYYDIVDAQVRWLEDSNILSEEIKP